MEKREVSIESHVVVCAIRAVKMLIYLIKFACREVLKTGLYTKFNEKK